LEEHYQDDYYKNQYPDVAASGIPGLLHYICRGHLEGRNPSELFDARYYLTRYRDVAASGMHPLLHYALFGAGEGRYAGRRMILPQNRYIGRSSPLAPERVSHDNRWPNNRPLISVVIPCFNYGSYVAEAIESVLKQTFRNYELIVVEGGSTDGKTPLLLLELANAYPDVRFVFRQESHLVGDNRNFGIRMAQGRYICCLDADDMIRPIYLEVAVFLAERFGYDVVYPSAQCFGGRTEKWLLVDATFPEIMADNQISTVALFRKDAWEAVGGYRDWGKANTYVFEDWDFWARMVGRGFRAKSIGEPLMLYRIHGSGLTATCESDRVHHRQAIAAANPDLVEGAPRPPREAEVVNPWANLGPLQSNGAKSVLVALPFLTIGGADRLLFTLVKGLVERGYRVCVVTTLSPPETTSNENGLFDPVTPNVYHLADLFPDEQHRPEFLRFVLRRYSIQTLMIVGSEFVYHLLPDIRAEFPEIRVIDQLFNDTGHIKNNRRYAGLIDLNIVPSLALKSTLTDRYGEAPEKVAIVPHAVPSKIPVFGSRAEAFAVSGLPARSQGKFLVSFFGRLSEEKSPQTFVKIARRLSSHRDIDFCMTGEGPQRKAVLDLIARYRLGERIFAPGFVPDVQRLIACSDVVVVPSRLDGMPLIVLEASMFGKPVVASSVGSLPEMIVDGVTGYICGVDDVKAFCSRIEQLYKSPDLRRRMGELARARAIAQYGARKMVDAYIDALSPPPPARVLPGCSVI